MEYERTDLDGSGFGVDGHHIVAMIQNKHQIALVITGSGKEVLAVALHCGLRAGQRMK